MCDGRCGRSCNRFKLDLNYGFVSSCTYLVPFIYMYKVREREQFRGWVNNDESLAPSALADDVTPRGGNSKCGSFRHKLLKFDEKLL